MTLTRLLWLVGQLHSCGLAVVPEVPVVGQWPLMANGLNILRLACPILNGIFSSEYPISLLFVTRWTGSSVMAAAISGFIRSVLVFLQRWQRRKTTSVCAVLGRTHQAESKNKTNTPLNVIQDSNQKISSNLSKATGLVFKPACTRCYFYSLRDHFSRTL